MDLSKINHSGLVMLGCGKMGSAMLEGWLTRGLAPAAVTILEPHPKDWLLAQGVTVNGALPEAPAAIILAVKPQMMGEALGALARYAGTSSVIVSIAAGTPISAFEAVFGATSPIIRAMPNTPAAIGRGITAMVGNGAAGAADLDLAQALLAAVGDVVRLTDEGEIDAVTGLSGSGPAYVFHLIECMAAAGEAEGLAPDLAMALARATVAGAGALAMESGEDPAQLRVNVTSPGGTTAAGLSVLMDESAGLKPLIRSTVAAATARSRELKG